MEVPVASPSNRFLVRQRDRHWPRVLSSVLAAAALVFVALFLVGWPRLKSTTIHYQLIRLRTEVDGLEQEAKRLQLELEVERNPNRLAARARGLGLVPPPSTSIHEEIQDGGAR